MKRSGEVRPIFRADEIAEQNYPKDDAVALPFLRLSWLASLPRDAVEILLVVVSGRSYFLPFGRRSLPFRVRMVSNPPFCAWTDIVADSGAALSPEARVSVAHEVAKVAAQSWPNAVVRLRLWRDFPSWLGFHWSGYGARANVSYVLDDAASAWGSVNSKLRNQIRKGAKSYECAPLLKSDLGDAVDLLLAHSVRKGFSYRLSRLEFLRFLECNFAAGNLAVFGARPPAGSLAAVALLGVGHNCNFYVAGGCDPEAEKLQVMSSLVWSLVEYTGVQGKSFDFEGSMLSGVEKFVRSFGGNQKVDTTIQMFPGAEKFQSAVKTVRRKVGI